MLVWLYYVEHVFRLHFENVISQLIFFKRHQKNSAALSMRDFLYFSVYLVGPKVEVTDVLPQVKWNGRGWFCSLICLLLCLGKCTRMMLMLETVRELECDYGELWTFQICPERFVVEREEASHDRGLDPALSPPSLSSDNTVIVVQTGISLLCCAVGAKAVLWYYLYHTQ